MFGTELITLLVYLIPSLAAIARKHPDKKTIILGNIFFGWTGIGWIISLYFAMTDPEPIKDESNTPNKDLFEEACEKLNNSDDEQVRHFSKLHLRQYAVCQKQAFSVKEILGRKLLPTELTFSRYAGALEHAADALRARLWKGVSILNSIDALQIKNVKARIADIEGIDLPSESSLKEKTSLEERVRTRKHLLQILQDLVVDSTHGISEIAKFSSSLVELNLDHGHSPVELESAISILEELAKSTHKYDAKVDDFISS